MAEVHGIEIDDLPEGFTALEIVYSVKCLDEDGSVSLVNGASDGLNTWEALGMVISAADDLRAGLQGDDVDD